MIGRGLEARLVAGEPLLHRGYQRHRFEILQDIPSHFRLQIGNHGLDAVAETANRVSVRLRAGDLLGSPETPGKLRMLNCWPILSAIFCVTIRAATSTALAAASGTI